MTGKFEDIEVNSFEVSEHSFLFYDNFLFNYSNTLIAFLCLCRLCMSSDTLDLWQLSELECIFRFMTTASNFLLNSWSINGSE